MCMHVMKTLRRERGLFSWTAGKMIRLDVDPAEIKRLEQEGRLIGAGVAHDYRV